jgi:hypothetical protein
MKSNLLITDKLQIGNEIFAYLIENPRVQNTLEGIVEWWLLEQEIIFETARVKDALSDPVARGFIIEKKGSNSQIQHRLNQRKSEEIKKLVKLMSG